MKVNSCKWDFATLYSSEDQLQADINKLLAILPTVMKMKNKLGSSLSVFKKALYMSNEAQILYEKIYTYALLRYETNMRSKKEQELLHQVENIGEEVYQKLCFIEPELITIENSIIKDFIIKDPELELYKEYIENLKNNSKSLLADKEEYLAEIKNLLNSPSSTYSILVNELNFGSIQINGENKEVNETNYFGYLLDKDRCIRKNALNAILATYGQYGHTFTSLLNANVEKDCVISKIMGYNSPITMALGPDGINTDTYDEYISTIKNSLPSLHNFIKLRKNILNIKNLYWYDLFVSLSESINEECTYNDAKKYILNAFSPLGSEYIGKVEEMFEEGWIDVYSSEGKVKGAYSMGVYRNKSFILLNYENKNDDLLTLAHEIGHAIHSYFSNKSQPFFFAEHSNFLGEIVALVNENLLIENLISQSNSNEERIYYLCHWLEKIRGMIYRQAMYAEFERYYFDYVLSGETLTLGLLNTKFGELLKDYFGPDLKVDELMKNEWMRVTHFYKSPFYVINYSLGFSIAVYIANKILSHGKPFVDNYLCMLNKGSSISTKEFIENIGLNAKYSNSLKETIHLFNKRVLELEYLIKNI